MEPLAHRHRHSGAGVVTRHGVDERGIGVVWVTCVENTVAMALEDAKCEADDSKFT